MQVLKFGGSSVANASNIEKAIGIIAKAADNDRTIVVCSAIRGFTDTLIRIAGMASSKDEKYKDLISEYRDIHHQIIRELLPVEKHEDTLAFCDCIFDSLEKTAYGVYLLGELSETSLDTIQGCGELLSSKIIAGKTASMGIETKWVDSRDVIKTVKNGKDNIADLAATCHNVSSVIESNPICTLFVFPGFIASDEKGRTVTLGRGGSDYTASLLAAGCNARILEIWTDVPGIMTADPKIAPSAKTISNISYRAAQELSHFGAKVIYPPTIYPAVSKNIPIYVKDTFHPDCSGTLIEQNPPRQKEKIAGISNSGDIALISLEGNGMVGIPGFSSRLFETLSRNGINIILITQASSVHTMCIAISEKDAEKAKKAADACFAYEISLGKLNPLKVEKGYSIVCIVGEDILNQCGTTGKMLSALGRHGISIRATAQGSSERNISVIVRSSDTDKAIRHIHDEFFENDSVKEINLFIAGYGTVGKALVDIIGKNAGNIEKRTGKRIKIAGISNSRKYTIDTGGLRPENIGKLLSEGKDASSEAYFKELAEIRLENSIFVDCTACSDIAYKYMNLFKYGYDVVACNKITFSSPYGQYRKLKETAIENGAALRYETTAGAALPILESISRSVNSGDRIHRIEAVLSGTLNYIFSTYDGGKTCTFAETVRKASSSGYTEPDPRLDLSGRDVLRKLLIIAREAGASIDEKDIESEPILSDSILNAKKEDFYTKLEENENVFAGIYAKAASEGKRLRYIASITIDGNSKPGYKAKMSLESIGSDHPLYNLSGTDNAAIITTDFYPSPLVIQGAGAGACQTASGLLNDILI